MVKRLAGRVQFGLLVAVMGSFLSHVDVATRAVADRLMRLREAKLGGLTWREAWLVSGVPAIAGGAGETAVGRDAHLDTPLTNVAIKAFEGAEGYVGQALFPAVPVGKQSDKYYVIDKDSWITVPKAFRAPKTSPRRIEWKVSSDSYFADNFALAGEMAKEDLGNADAAIRLRENTTMVVTEGLARDLEVRIASRVTSISNVGSGVALTGPQKWGDYVASDPIADVTTAHAFIRQKTGLLANTLVLDYDTYQVARRHPVLLDMFKYTSGGLLADEQLRNVFGVEQILIPRGIKNMAAEGATASIVNIWGNIALLARVMPGTTLQTATFGLSFRWQPPEIPAAMQVFRYDDPDPGRKVEIVEVGYYQDERVTASDLAYLIKDTL
jgi:hypothetical protein